MSSNLLSPSISTSSLNFNFLFQFQIFLSISTFSFNFNSLFQFHLFTAPPLPWLAFDFSFLNLVNFLTRIISFRIYYMGWFPSVNRFGILWTVKSILLNPFRNSVYSHGICKFRLKVHLQGPNLNPKLGNKEGFNCIF